VGAPGIHSRDPGLTGPALRGAGSSAHRRHNVGTVTVVLAVELIASGGEDMESDVTAEAEAAVRLQRREEDAAQFLARRAVVNGRPPTRSGRWTPTPLDAGARARVEEGARRWHRAVVGRDLEQVVWVDCPAGLARFGARWRRQRCRARGARWRWRLRLMVRGLVSTLLLPFLAVPVLLTWYLLQLGVPGGEAVLFTLVLLVIGGWLFCVASYAAALFALDAAVPWIRWTDDARVPLDRLEPLVVTGVPDDEDHKGDSAASDDWCPTVLTLLAGLVAPAPPAGLRQEDGGVQLLYGQGYRCAARVPVVLPSGRTTRAGGLTLSWLHGRHELLPGGRADDLVGGWEALTAGPYAIVVFPDLVVAVRPPTEVSLERLPDGTLRLHDDDGPALRWADGTADHVLHGVTVPADLFLGRWDVARIRAEPNSELRRLAIERLGWDRFIELSGLTPIARAQDPANEGAELELYAVPGVEHRVLLMRNGSPDRSGLIRRYAEGVPARMGDPVAAAAWQYGVPVEVYRTLQRRT